MKQWKPEKCLTVIIQDLELGRYFARDLQQMITYDMEISKGITILANTSLFNE